MAGSEQIRIEVAYADPQREIVIAVDVPRGTTAGEAIDASGLSHLLPAIGARGRELALRGKRVAPDRVLASGDRIDVLRPLRVDPKAARRERVVSDRGRHRRGGGSR